MNKNKGWSPFQVLYGYNGTYQNKGENMVEVTGEVVHVAPNPLDTEPLMQFFGYSHLPANLQPKSKLFHDLASELITTTPSNFERTAALRKLLEAKDCAVRAMIYKPVVRA